MLETLRLAYQFACDVVIADIPSGGRRLTKAKARILGYRLAQYWVMKP